MARLRKANQQLPDLITIKQFCIIYQVGSGIVYRLIKEKKLTAVKVGTHYRIVNDYKSLQVIPELNESYILRETEVAELLACTPRNVRYMCDGGKLAFKWNKSVRRFRVKDVHDFMRIYKRGAGRPITRPEMINWARRQLQALDTMK